MFRHPSRKKQLSDPPDHYEDPLDLKKSIVIHNSRSALDNPVPIPTGLSDIDDAKRIMVLKFDPTLGYCRNCEGTFKCDTDGHIVLTTWCPVCIEREVTEFLCVLGTAPYGSRNKR